MVTDEHQSGLSGVSAGFVTLTEWSMPKPLLLLCSWSCSDCSTFGCSPLSEASRQVIFKPWEPELWVLLSDQQQTAAVSQGSEVQWCHEEWNQITCRGADFLIFLLLPCVASRLPPVTMAIGIPGTTLENWARMHTVNYLHLNMCISSILVHYYITKHFSVYYTINSEFTSYNLLITTYALDIRKLL